MILESAFSLCAGLMVAIVRGLAPEGTMERSFLEPLMDIPKVPGLGLCLDTVCLWCSATGPYYV
jgi:hypothetical protein